MLSQGPNIRRVPQNADQLKRAQGCLTLVWCGIAGVDYREHGVAGMAVSHINYPRFVGMPVKPPAISA